MRLLLDTTRRREFPFSPKYGIRQLEMFAVKNMEVNSALLKLKLDMVYRDLPLEEAETRFAAAKIPPPAPAAAPAVLPLAAKRKVVVPLKPKSK